MFFLLPIMLSVLFSQLRALGIVPMCSFQYERMFNTTRIPGIETGNDIFSFNIKLHVIIQMFLTVLCVVRFCAASEGQKAFGGLSPRAVL